MNIETWAYIRHLFFVQKLQKKVIARKLGLDPKTVRRALRKESFDKAPSSPRPSKLDDFKNTIDDLLSAYPTLRAEDLANAWAFYRAHTDEIDRQVEENEAA